MTIWNCKGRLVLSWTVFKSIFQLPYYIIWNNILGHNCNPQANIIIIPFPPSFSKCLITVYSFYSDTFCPMILSSLDSRRVHLQCSVLGQSRRQSHTTWEEIQVFTVACWTFLKLLTESTLILSSRSWKTETILQWL